MFKPMLAVDHEESELRFPYLASPKIDGIRCIVIDGEARTRTMKPIPNLYVAAWFRKHAKVLEGLDGELTIGTVTAKNVFATTTSGIMRYQGMPAFTYHVFDVIDPTGKRTAAERQAELAKRAKSFPASVQVLPQVTVKAVAELKLIEDGIVNAGFEGVMLRSPKSTYKQGRATLNENSLLKVKRFRDAEAVIVGVEEQMYNGNVAFTNELGHTKRSSAKAGLKGKGTLGALIVKCIDKKQPFHGVEFNIGTGFDDNLKMTLWNKRGKLNGLVVKFKYLDCGVKDKPRHPVFLGFRKD